MPMISQKSDFYFFIDIVGSCNLRCPSCPVSNSANYRNTTGVMSPTILNRILKKAVTECKITGVGLFNWTEPLLHPEIDEMVSVVKKIGLRCLISSNLNINNPDRYRKLLAAAPSVLCVSLSGFSQEKYGLTHQGGQIEVVKQNLKLLLKLKKELDSKTLLKITFHRYLENGNEEEIIRRFCDSTGILFQVVNARMHPLEKVLAYCGEIAFSDISPNDMRTINNLALPLKDALDVCSAIKNGPCALLEKQIVINWKGDVLLCCGVYDEKRFFIAPFLNTSMESLQKMRREHTVCSLCKKYGISNYYLGNFPKANALVTANIGRVLQRNKKFAYP